jgi:hypothetical protein
VGLHLGPVEVAEVADGREQARVLGTDQRRQPLDVGVADQEVVAVGKDAQLRLSRRESAMVWRSFIAIIWSAEAPGSS